MTKPVTFNSKALILFIPYYATANKTTEIVTFQLAIILVNV